MRDVMVLDFEVWMYILKPFRKTSCLNERAEDGEDYVYGCG